MDKFSEQRLSLVMPELALRVRQLAVQLGSEGIVIRVVQGLRTVAEQDALYAQGRTTPGKIVTKARGGQSYHNYGLAVDCVPSINGIDQSYEPDWNEFHLTWLRMESIGESLGLDSGAQWRTFKDYPHFQLNGPFPEAAPNAKCKDLYATGSLESVWDAVRKHLALGAKTQWQPVK